MGRQSSRLWFGRDHKDIYFNGHYHKAMYLTDSLANPKLVWEKLANEYFAMRVVDYMADYQTGEMVEGGTPGYVSFNIQEIYDDPYAIDWGDGTITKGVRDHIYATSNGTEYTVKISGPIRSFRASEVLRGNNGYSSIGSCVTEILTPLLRNMSVLSYNEETGGKPQLSAMFAWTPLLKKIPSNLFKNMRDFESVSANSFFEHSGIEEIPPNLFRGLKNWNINGFFASCNKIVTVPPNTFINGTFMAYSPFLNNANLRFVYDHPQGVGPRGGLTTCPSVEVVDCEFVGLTSIEEAFSGMRKLETVGKNIFKYSPDITYAKGCFKNCMALKEIPEGLFDGLTKVTNFQECFYECRSIKSIPNGLFKDSHSAINFSACFQLCSSLESLPGDMFSGVNSGANFSYAFYQLNIASIPLDLFANCATDSIFTSTFRGCKNITSNVPDLWNYSNQGSYCYEDCESAANYDDIPNNWK